MAHILNRPALIGGTLYQPGVDVSKIADAGELVSLVSAQAVDIKRGKDRDASADYVAPKPDPTPRDNAAPAAPAEDAPAPDQPGDEEPTHELADVSVDTLRESNAADEDALTLDDDVVDILAAAGLDTLGKLDTYRKANGGKFVKVRGIGRATSPRIVAALDRLLAPGQ